MKKDFPKKAKLITDGGFYQIINIEEFTPTIRVPLVKRVSLATPETGVLDIDAVFSCEFTFERATKRYAIYQQTNVTNVIK
jgi:hypothetical protein